MRSLLIFVALSLIAQPPPAPIKVETTHAPNANPYTRVTATSGPLVCVLHNPDPSAPLKPAIPMPPMTQISIQCSVGDVVYLDCDVEPGFNLVHTRGRFTAGGPEVISWELWQAITGVVTYTVTAGGVTRGGNF